MHVAASHRESPGPKFTKFGESIGQTPNHANFRRAVTTSVRNICWLLSKIYRKSGPKFTTIGDDLLCTNARHRAKFYRARPNAVRKRRYQFSHPSLFWRQSSPISKVPSIVAAKLRRFRRRRDPRTQKNSNLPVNDMSPHTMRRQKAIGTANVYHTLHMV